MLFSDIYGKKYQILLIACVRGVRVVKTQTAKPLWTAECAVKSDQDISVMFLLILVIVYHVIAKIYLYLYGKLKFLSGFLFLLTSYLLVKIFSCLFISLFLYWLLLICSVYNSVVG